MEAIDIDSIPTPKKFIAIFYWGRFGKFTRGTKLKQ